MKTPAYNAAGRSRGGFVRRAWGFVTGQGSQLDTKTPRYLGGGQPQPERRRALFGDATPIYRSAPSPATPQAITMPSTTPSDTTASPPAPQPGQMAIVVRRS